MSVKRPPAGNECHFPACERMEDINAVIRAAREYYTASEITISEEPDEDNIERQQWAAHELHTALKTLDEGRPF